VQSTTHPDWLPTTQNVVVDAAFVTAMPPLLSLVPGLTALDSGNGVTVHEAKSHEEKQG
jgi:hypothetical protein